MRIPKTFIEKDIKAFRDLKASKSMLLKSLIQTPNTPFKSIDLNSQVLNVTSENSSDVNQCLDSYPSLALESNSLHVNPCLDSYPSLDLESCPTKPLDCCPTPAPVLVPV